METPEAVSDMNVTIAMVQIMIMRIETEMLSCCMRSIYCTIYQTCINMYHMRIQLTTIDQLSQYHNDENLALHVLNLVLQTCEACLPRCVGFCTSTPRVFPSGLMPSNTSSLMVPG